MLLTLQGVVLKTTKYAENSLIVHIFTRQRGMQGFILGGVHGKKGKNKLAIVQLFNLVNLVAYVKDGSSLWRIKEIKNMPPYQNIPFDIAKQTMAFFINEVIYKSVRNVHEPDDRLFDYVFNNAQYLDLTPQLDPNFHLRFMLRLSRILGFYPDRAPDEETECWFDLKEGKFERRKPFHPLHLNRDQTKTFLKFMEHCEDQSEHKFTREERQTLAENLANYYDLQLEGFGSLRSLSVLKEIFD